MNRILPVMSGVVAVTPAVPIEAYSIWKKELTSRKGLKAARPAGWLILLLNGLTAVAAVSISNHADVLRLRGIHYGPFVSSEQRGIELAESTPGGGSPNYELRMLDIPSISLIALWLHGTKDDFIIPLDPAPQPLVKEKVYSSADFLDDAHLMARLKGDARKKASGHMTN